MILIDAVDAALAIWEALVITIVVLAFVGTVVLLAGLACGTWAVKRAWRAYSGPCGASEPESGPREPQGPESPSGARLWLRSVRVPPADAPALPPSSRHSRRCGAPEGAGEGFPAPGPERASDRRTAPRWAHDEQEAA